MTSAKQELKEIMLEILREKENSLLDQKQSLEESRNSASKSTAGDKHEVGRAMVQTEIENLNVQLSNCKEQIHLIRGLEDSINDTVQPGSLVTTSSGLYYLSLGLGKIRIGDREVYAISPASPIGSILLGKKKGEKIAFRGSEAVIEKVE